MEYFYGKKRGGEMKPKKHKPFFDKRELGKSLLDYLGFGNGDNPFPEDKTYDEPQTPTHNPEPRIIRYDNNSYVCNKDKQICVGYCPQCPFGVRV